MRALVPATLTGLLLVGCTGGDAPPPARVEDTVARLIEDERTFVRATREEFLVAMDRRLEDLDAILSATRAANQVSPAARHDGPHDDLREREADLAAGLADLRVSGAGWPDDRAALVQEWVALRDDAIAAWSRRDG